MGSTGPRLVELQSRGDPFGPPDRVNKAEPHDTLPKSWRANTTVSLFCAAFHDGFEQVNQKARFAPSGDFLAQSFDPVQARMIGLRTGWLHYGLLAILSATIVAMLSSVGILLSVADLIAPGAIAFLLARRFAALLVTSIIVALIAGITGIYAAFWLDTGPAPSIVLILTGMFLVALFAQQRRERRATAQQ